MKKAFLIFLLSFILFGLVACNQPRNIIKGMEVKYETTTEFFKSNYGMIVGENIIIYVALSSSKLTPSVYNLSKSDNTITVQVDATSKSKHLSDDITYWKITIRSNYKYLKNIDDVKVLVVLKH